MCERDTRARAPRMCLWDVRLRVCVLVPRSRGLPHVCFEWMVAWMFVRLAVFACVWRGAWYTGILVIDVCSPTIGQIEAHLLIESRIYIPVNCVNSNQCSTTRRLEYGGGGRAGANCIPVRHSLRQSRFQMHSECAFHTNRICLCVSWAVFVCEFDYYTTTTPSVHRCRIKGVNLWVIYGLKNVRALRHNKWSVIRDLYSENTRAIIYAPLRTQFKYTLHMYASKAPCEVVPRDRATVLTPQTVARALTLNEPAIRARTCTRGFEPLRIF